MRRYIQSYGIISPHSGRKQFDKRSEMARVRFGKYGEIILRMGTATVLVRDTEGKTFVEFKCIGEVHAEALFNEIMACEAPVFTLTSDDINLTNPL